MGISKEPRLDSTHQRILNMLIGGYNNASSETIAKALGWKPETVRRKVRELAAHGFVTIIDGERDGAAGNEEAQS